MNLSRVFPLIVACGLQLMPVARVVSNAVLPSSTFAIVFKWAAGAVALLGSFHAVSGASAKITGMVKYVGTTPVGSPTNNAVEPVNEPFKYRITVANAGSDHKKDYFNCIPVPPGLTINTNIGGTGYITGTPTTVGVYPVTLYAGNTSYPKPVTYDATITITAVGTPPAITTQPASQTVTAGANVTFTVAATGTDPLSYQWRKDGADLGGATGATLTRNSVTASDAGNYTVVVSNVAGSVASSAATLTVNVPPSITAQPASQTVNEGANVNFTVTASGTAPLSYQWKKDSVNIAGATSTTLTLNSVTASQAGSYTVLVSNVAGSVPSAAATLTVNVPPSIITPPASQTVNEGANVTFSVAASGTAPLSYQWKKDNVAIAEATSATLTLNSVTTSQAGSYTVVVSNVAGSAASSAATLTVNVPPSITTQPANQTVNEGSKVTFSVIASGTAPLSYQWKKDNVNIAGATSATLTLNSVTASQAGSYTVLVSNVAGTVPSAAATLTVNVPPTITTQPANQTVNEGSNVTFSVVASGTAPLSYQWKKDNVAIVGATSATLTLNSVTTSQAGSYTVVVSNVAGSVPSAAATLTVQQPFEVKLRFASSTTVNGHFKCSLTGPINSSYIIWASTDLVHWTAVQTNRVVDGTSEYLDPGPLGTGSEFYRATAAP